MSSSWREVMLGVPLRPDWHRYMVVMAAADGYRWLALVLPALAVADEISPVSAAEKTSTSRRPRAISAAPARSSAPQSARAHAPTLPLPHSRAARTVA